MEKIIWAIDPGNLICGVCQLTGSAIGHCFNEKSVSVYRRILSLSEGKSIEIVIEDIKPYSLRLTPQVIDTCKIIGELTYRFNMCKQVTSVNLVARNSVKKWIFDTCPDVVIPRIEKKMMALHTRKIAKGMKGLIKADGEMRIASFHFVDDRSVIAALKSIYNIPTPKPGKQNIFGLVDHSWQALAAGAYHSHIGNYTNENK